METSKATIRQSYIDLRGLNLGMDFVKNNNLQSGQKYAMIIEGFPDDELQGTLDKSGFIGGLSLLYRRFDFAIGDEVDVRFDNSVIVLSPPKEKRVPDKSELPEQETTKPVPAAPKTVFETQNLKHLHIEPYAPRNLQRWIPQTEPDVYMAFGALSEYTDYEYCCGASKSLLEKLGYDFSDKAKPDAVLIDRTTDQYLIAEFKMNSKDFSSNHSKEDIDVLVCWQDDESNKSSLPSRICACILCLRKRFRRATSNYELPKAFN